MKIVAVAAAAVASALLLSPFASSAGSVEHVTRSITYADLDLATKAGRSRLDRRLATAAADACGSASDLDLVGQNAVRRCRVTVLQVAAAQREIAIAQAGGAAQRLAMTKP